MAKEPTTVTRVPNGDTANQSLVVFPLDATGFTSMFRKEGVRAIGRMSASDDKFEVFVQTLRVLAAHAKAKLEAQKGARVASIALSDELSALEAARAEADRLAEVSRLERDITAATAKLAAINE